MPKVQAKTMKSSKVAARRSPCPLACSLDLIGDRWTLLIIRDLMLGLSRFKDFTASPEGIPTNVLSDRLERMVEHQLIQQVPASDGTKRLAYALTPKGRELRPMLRILRNWGLKWEPGTRAELDPNPSRTKRTVGPDNKK
jgi:DNA-binding HxlR family transcriptional regulator